MSDSNAGYHIAVIPKGELGEFTKVLEEFNELQDALDQGSKVMALVELSDMMGAIQAYLDNHFPGFTIDDLKKFSNITKRAFENGHRK